MSEDRPRSALRFVLLIGVTSLFADFTYEGARSITGPYLAILGASATIVGIVAGLGELLGYALRLPSGRISEATQKFWPITIFGYVIQMAAVPLLAFARTWQLAAILIILERVGKAIRNPPRDVMLSHAAQEMGLGWGFGVHEALDQAGALIGPLVVAAILSSNHAYSLAFETLAIPAGLTITMLLIARFVYPHPEHLEPQKKSLDPHGFSRAFWIYLAGACLVAAGFVDFSLAAFHFEKSDAIPAMWVPIFYSVAMAVSGAGSLIFGKMFDRAGLRILVPLTIVSAAATPLLFLGGFGLALTGAAIWGLGMGVHESIIPAAVASMVPVPRRPSAYGLFTAAYGVAWFLGSALLGFLYDVSRPALIAFSIAAELIAIPFFIVAQRHE